MFALAFLSAVSAENVWGDFTAANCKDREFADAGEAKQCLNHVGEKWTIVFWSTWSSMTCEEYTDEKKEEYCKKHQEFLSCCGKVCGEIKDSLGCSANFGFNKDLTEKIDELVCESADEEDTTCKDMNDKMTKNLKINPMLECKENKCVFSASAVPKDEGKGDEGTKTKGKGEKDGEKDNESGNAFALGLSTLAGALVLLQL